MHRVFQSPLNKLPFGTWRMQFFRDQHPGGFNMWMHTCGILVQENLEKPIPQVQNNKTKQYTPGSSNIAVAGKWRPLWLSQCFCRLWKNGGIPSIASYVRSLIPEGTTGVDLGRLWRFKWGMWVPGISWQRVKCFETRNSGKMLEKASFAVDLVFIYIV